MPHKQPYRGSLKLFISNKQILSKEFASRARRKTIMDAWVMMFSGMGKKVYIDVRFYKTAIYTQLPD